MKVAVCDDQQVYRDSIIRQFKQLCADADITEFSSGFDLLSSDTDFDVVFLDIEMPEIDGMSTAQKLRDKNSQSRIIFLTSHTEFMPDAFKVRAFRFLSKPIETERFREAVSEVMNDVSKEKRLVVNEHGKVINVSVNDIVCFEAFGDGTYLYTRNDFIESSKTLKYWLEQVGSEHFFQTHKSYAVALKYIRSVEKTEVDMNYMKTKVPVSRRNVNALKERFVEYTTKYAGIM